MELQMAHSLAIFFSFLVILLYLRSWSRRSRRLPLPPGPIGLPLIGNILDIPRTYIWLKYAQLAQIYGDIIKINSFGKTTIILHSWEAAVELLEKRAFNYSDRPRMVMANDLAGWEWDFAHMPYTDRWRFVSSISLRAAYGYEVQEANDFLIDLVHQALQSLLLIVPPGNYLVDHFPSLQHVPSWFPGAGFKMDAHKWAVGARAMLNMPFEATKESMRKGIAKQSFAFDGLRKLEIEGTTMSDEEEIIKNCAAMIYIAGSDTTASLLHSWFLAMAQYPDVQRKAQAEIDKVIGSSRLPTFEDRPSTPYIEAMLLETMRWAPVTPLALPHRAVCADEYNGYYIPAGATITVNVWAILHDERLYPEPFIFRPERFIAEDGEAEIEKDPILVGAFGFGRRICPGRHLATTSAWLAISSILSTYNITKCVDELGNVIEPSTEYTDGLVSHPKSFRVQITPRSENVEGRIKAAELELPL